MSLEVALDSSVARRREAGPDEFADAWIRTVSVGLTCVQRTGSLDDWISSGPDEKLGAFLLS